MDEKEYVKIRNRKDKVKNYVKSGYIVKLDLFIFISRKLYWI